MKNPVLTLAPYCLLLFISLSSCTKENDNFFSIKFDSPKENQAFSDGDKIKIKGKLSAKSGISFYKVIIDKGVWTLWWDSQDVDGKKSYNFEHTYTYSADGVAWYGYVYIEMYDENYVLLLKDGIPIEFNP
ncbi:MAG: hypothetical protein WA004_12065 [Saprospiraceae bacterium]